MSNLEKNYANIVDKSIAIIGVSGGCPDAEATAGEPLEPLFFCSSSEPGDKVRPDLRLFLETVWLLLEQAGHTREGLKRDYDSSLGVFVGADTDGKGAAGSAQSEEIADRVARYFDLRGPVATVDMSGSSAQAIVDMACRSLASGQCKLAIAGGINLSVCRADPSSSKRAESGTSSDVFLPGEGAGAVLLQPLSQAIADGNAILAVIKPFPGRDGDDVGSAHMIELDSDARLPEETARGSAIEAAHACSAEMIVLSAHTPDALRVLAWRLLDRIKRGTLGTVARNGSGASLTDLACTLQSCREAMNCRLAMVVSGFEELVCGLEAYLLATDEAAAVVQKILGHTRAGVPITVYRGDLDKSTQVTSLLSGSAGEAMVKALLLEGDLGNLALCWVQGAKVDWKDLQKGKSPHKAALPSYPFSISKQERQLLRDGVSSLRLSESEPASDGIRSASVGAVESALTAIWKELFGLERIGRHQNFFELGGNSQLGMHMISRVRDAMQVDLPLSYLYETLTIAKMSEKIAHLAALSAMPFDIAGAENDNDYEVGIIQ